VSNVNTSFPLLRRRWKTRITERMARMPRGRSFRRAIVSYFAKFRWREIGSSKWARRSHAQTASSEGLSSLLHASDDKIDTGGRVSIGNVLVVMKEGDVG